MTSVHVVEVVQSISVVEGAPEVIEVGIAGPQGAPGAAGTAGATGPTGPQGAQGTPGSAPQAYTHIQSVPATVWNVAHNLTFRPQVFVEDTTGRDVEGEIEHVDVNNLTLTFSAAFAGAAYLS